MHNELSFEDMALVQQESSDVKSDATEGLSRAL